MAGEFKDVGVNQGVFGQVGHGPKTANRSGE